MKHKIKLHTIGGVAELLDVSEKTVRRLIDAETLPCVASPIGPRVHGAALLEYVKKMLNQYSEKETGQAPKEIGENPRLISVDAAQCALDCSRAMIRQLIEAGDLAACKIGRLIRISAESINQFQSEKILQFIKNQRSDDFK